MITTLFIAVGILSSLLFLAVLAIGYQRVVLIDIRQSRDEFSSAYVNMRNDYESFRSTVRAGHAEMIAKLRGVCNELTPSPLEDISDDVAQELVDTFNNTQYKC